MLKRVVFLDRDGTINRDSFAFVKSRQELEFLPGSLEALRDLTSNGFVTIVITNQSAVRRQLISLKELESIHNLMLKTVALNGGMITDFFYCPHRPEDNCECRKPEPGLIYQAREKYTIDLASAVMVGDSAKDIECARRAGCGRAVLVKTGKDDEVEGKLKTRQLRVDYVAQDLRDAAEWIITHNR